MNLSAHRQRKSKSPGLISILFTLSLFSIYSSHLLADEQLEDFSLEELMDIEVTSVSKKSQKLSDAAAAIFVITNDDIRRSGATSIPEALRMAPGINVDRVDSNKWAITSRGFNGRYANKLLVMIDGRSVYDPIFSGTYWETQDLLLEDIERIEVIRGPGGTLWGTNAVNGVINIITKHAIDTQGGYIEAGAGTEEKEFVGARYGVKLNETTFGRAYLKAFERDESRRETGEGAKDDWNMLRGGFRLDSEYSTNDNFTLQGDFFSGDLNNQINIVQNISPYQLAVDDTVETSDWNVLGRWNHTSSSSSEFSLQFYYNKYKRNEIFTNIDRDTFDLDFQHRFFLGKRHDILWGAGYRYTSDRITPTPSVYFENSTPRENTYNLFLQDEITLLKDRLWFTLGTKFQHSNLSNYGLQPSARILWVPHPKHRLWASVSRAERSPSHADRFVHINALVLPVPSPVPVILTVNGQPDFKPEKLTAFEVGHRVSLSSSLSVDTTVFYNKYTDLSSFIEEETIFQGTYIELPSVFKNNDKGKAWGFEVASSFQASDWWGIDLAYSYLRKSISPAIEKASSNLLTDPRHRVSIRSNMDLSENLDLDLWLKYSSGYIAPDNLSPGMITPDNNLTLDVRLGWEPVNRLTFELIGQNLLENRHLEYQSNTFYNRSEVERSVYGQISWKF